MTKVCTKCKKTKSDDEFYSRPAYVRKDGTSLSGRLSPRCKVCKRDDCEEWKRANPFRVLAESRERYANSPGYREVQRNSHYRRKYGITVLEYNKLMESQKGKCAICGGHPTGGRFHKADGSRLHVDHNHNTGKVRGLLCYRCNAGIGLFMDDINNMRNAVRYMEVHNG